ncbi:MAG TPA: aldo/keto reductase, partial [Candidatus Obscuribacterales bacterium]|nr:aldo/keto reductase [Candidatus Obscuribacterales bacterium]
HGATLGQLVIAWTIAQPGITAALVGARDAAQTKENLKAQNVKLTKEDIDEINNHLRSLELTAAVK